MDKFLHKEAHTSLNAVLIIPYVGVNQIFSPEEVNKYKSSVASDRLQIRPLVKALTHLNYRTQVVSLNKNFELSELEGINNADICIISKMRSHTKKNANKFAQFHAFCALTLKRRGSKLMLIYSDHVASSNSPDGELYKNLIYLSDHIVTPSKKLKTLAHGATSNKPSISIIEDPCLLAKKEFQTFKSDEKVKIIWFGNFKNLEYLLNIADSLLNVSIRSILFELTILTSDIGIKKAGEIFRHLNIPKNWTVRLVLWNIHDQPQQLEKELLRANISLLPSDPSDPTKAGVSHNRLVDSIQSGCIALASPIESYQELSKVCLIGNNFPAMLTYAINNNARLCSKYSKLRPEALERFDANLNILKWEESIKITLSS
ncbi:hypothetical protein BL107_05989 [Synechococcus sp. BL107]|uniref:hypothetical protein n=1 Tax=Synechococcus sp. BL107 TaxID=313625 RepID=UPI0000E53B84|nr:hypothetical protein [Synechococcus sp. BL107]EAU71057.1 hypothetical protein BL107_05989 [Synechococcus sp. BL107]